MLSQHIALDIHRFYKAAINKGPLANNSAKQNNRLIRNWKTLASHDPLTGP